MRDVTILLDPTQGRPAQLLAELAGADVVIEAGCLFPRLEQRVVHVAVAEDHVAATRTAAARVGATVADDRECLVVEGDPGGDLADIATKVADAGGVVQVAYFGRRGQLVLATADLDATRAALDL